MGKYSLKGMKSPCKGDNPTVLFITGPIVTLFLMSAGRERLMQAEALVTSPSIWTMMIKFPPVVFGEAVAAASDDSTALSI